MKTSRLPSILSCCVLLFLYLPIIILIINSFNYSAFGSSWEGFSFRWYLRIFSEKEILNAFKNSVLIGFFSSILAAFFGTCSAFAIDRYQGRLQRLHYCLIFTPLLIPEILSGICLLIFFIVVGIQLSLTTVFLAHVTFCISYVCLVILGRLQYFDKTLIDAAFDLGASPLQVATKVVLPLLSPGILAGVLLAFTLSMDDFVITSFVAGPGSTTLPLRIYSMMKHGYPALISVLSTILFCMTFLFVAMAQKLINKR